MRPPPDEEAKAPQILAGAEEVVVAVTEEEDDDEDEEDDPFPPFPPLLRLAANDASPLSAAELALPVVRDLAPLLSLDVVTEVEEEEEEAGGSLTLEELRDLPGDLRASTEGVIVMLPT